MEKMSLVVAVRKHLILPGEKLPAISAQYKALTKQDKEDLKRDFLASGIDTYEPEAAPGVVAVA